MGNFFGVLTSPTATFERLRNDGGWVLTLILLTVLAVLSVWLTGDAMVGTIEQELIKAEEMGQEIPAEFRDMTLSFALVIGYVTAAISVLATMFVGGLLLLLVNLIVRGEATYMQLSKVALYAYIPTAIGTVLTGIISFATGAASLFDVSLTAGAFVEDKSSMLFVLAQMINPFAIWGLILLIIGTSVMTRKGRGQVATWIVIGWLIISFLTLLGSKAAA